MAERGIKSVEELIGIALPRPIVDFMALSSEKKISACWEEVCLSCGNCTRCPYMAITLNEKKNPVTDTPKSASAAASALRSASAAPFTCGRERPKRRRPSASSIFRKKK